jgi:hypothetical protein
VLHNAEQEAPVVPVDPEDFLDPTNPLAIPTAIDGILLGLQELIVGIFPLLMFGNGIVQIGGICMQQVILFPLTLTSGKELFLLGEQVLTDEKSFVIF